MVNHYESSFDALFFNKIFKILNVLRNLYALIRIKQIFLQFLDGGFSPSNENKYISLRVLSLKDLDSFSPCFSVDLTILCPSHVGNHDYFNRRI